MHSNSPGTLALLIALILAITAVVANILIGYFLPNDSIVNIVLLFILALIGSFFVVNYFISRYLTEKINLIYKSIHKSKEERDSNKVINTGDDVFSIVNKEVEEWIEENEKQREQLQLREAFRREFIGNVSHELKTPIFNIQGYILTLLEGGLEDENINRKFLLRAEKSVNRMIDLVKDLDTITQLESGQLNLEKSRVNLADLVKEVIESIEEIAKEHQIKVALTKDYDPQLYVDCDKNRIYQVLLNLIINSVKYGKEGGKTEINFHVMDKNVLVEISDNGPGIESKHLPRLFERFYRIEESRSRNEGGSGLGLAIVKHIIEAHGQTINVRSTVGVGSTFSFTLRKA